MKVNLPPSKQNTPGSDKLNQSPLAYGSKGKKRSVTMTSSDKLEASKRQKINLLDWQTSQEIKPREGFSDQVYTPKSIASFELSHGLAAESKIYLAQGRPFFFLIDRGDKQAFAARDYVQNIADEEAFCRLQRKPPPKTPYFEAGYLSSSDGEIHLLGNLSVLYTDKAKKALINCMCSLSIDDHEKVHDEALITIGSST